MQGETEIRTKREREERKTERKKEGKERWQGRKNMTE